MYRSNVQPVYILANHVIRTFCGAACGPCGKSIVPEPLYAYKMPRNEPIMQYELSCEREQIIKAISDIMLAEEEEIPIVIGDEEIRRTGCPQQQFIPHDFRKSIATFYHASAAQLNQAIEVAVKAQVSWDQTPWYKRFEIWTKAADLMAGPYRQQLNAATMLGQSKTIIQAEIDAACELIDFIRMHMFFAQESYKYQPISENKRLAKNSLRQRGIEGFIAAISPFNFTAIGGNLAYTPALMGNAVLWKPSDTAILSNWLIFKIMREAGVPPGVVNFVPSQGPLFGKVVSGSPHFAGLNFTGSVRTFQKLWKQIGQNIERYNNYPRLVGECGGKNFHFVHPSANTCAVVAGTIRSAFEYCGQKCSACSRMYVPECLWDEIRDELLANREAIKYGDVADFQNFMGAVIDGTSFTRIKGYIEYAAKSDRAHVLGGGCCDDSNGFFIAPTIVQVQDATDMLMREEIFGPVLAIYVYKDDEVEKTIDILSSSTKFALTGAVYAQDKQFLENSFNRFKHTAGNLYINDKCTGSVVGQQPFGGGRQSGTNDKAGGMGYVTRWSSPQAIKEVFDPQLDIAYPYMSAKLT